MSDDLYSNALADEFLPGIMYPFNWSALAPIVDASWNRIRRDLRVEGEDVGFVRTFYHHAYWNLTRVTAVLQAAGLTQAVIDRLFERPVSRNRQVLDETTVDRVLAMDRSALIEHLEQSIAESEKRLEEVQRKKGSWETEDEIVREFDAILDILGEVIFRETSSWLLVGANLSVLDEWTGQREGKHRRQPEIFIPQIAQAKLDEVRALSERYHTSWEASRAARASARSLAEERLYELGDRFVKWHLLRTKEDVRYLTIHEVRQIVSGGCSTNTCNNYALRATVRRTEIDDHAMSDLPVAIRGEAAPLLPFRKDVKKHAHGRLH
jgi:hypothetical protein